MCVCVFVHVKSPYNNRGNRYSKYTHFRDWKNKAHVPSNAKKVRPYTGGHKRNLGCLYIDE